jgi:hypothetical protein
MCNVRRVSGQKCHAKGSRKESKYKCLCTDIERTWNIEFMITPVMIGATGVATKLLKKLLEAMLGKYSVDFLKETTMLGTSYTLR